MGRFKCGCPVDTQSIWRDKDGRIVRKGSLHATSVTCLGCGSVTRLIQNIEPTAEEE